MRTYPMNSPRAAARLVAVAMLADGHYCKSEIDALDRVQAHAALGISSAEWQAVVRELCEDLLSVSQHGWGAACHDPGMLKALLSEVDDRELRGIVAGLCAAVVHADDHAADGEAVVLTSMRENWRLMQPLTPPPSRGAAQYV